MKLQAEFYTNQIQALEQNRWTDALDSCIRNSFDIHLEEQDKMKISRGKKKLMFLIDRAET